LAVRWTRKKEIGGYDFTREGALGDKSFYYYFYFTIIDFMEKSGYMGLFWKAMCFLVLLII
jgi:hypothetical protein